VFGKLLVFLLLHLFEFRRLLRFLFLLNLWCVFRRRLVLQL
jgi:hypothetical protein